MAEPDCRKQLGGEPLKYISVQGPHWLRNDGIVERRSSDGRTLLQHRHVPRESPWVALSAGAVGGAHLALVCEMAWLRADGAVDLTVTACYFDYNKDASNREAALIHDFKHQWPNTRAAPMSSSHPLAAGTRLLLRASAMPAALASRPRTASDPTAWLTASPRLREAWKAG